MATDLTHVTQGKAASLYVHFPFCETKCHYCDFYSIGAERTAGTDPNKFEEALAREARIQEPLLALNLNTIFFGGGTPSMTSASSMARALKSLNLNERVTDETEWTMEANPSSVSIASLREYRTLGVNRISMGVQALRDDLLARLGRVHSSDRALHALDEIFESGFDNVSVDLLCGVPGQSLQVLEEALSKLTSYPITHLSCYLLTLPKGHRMYGELPAEDEQLRHLLLIHDWMTARGFEHYEISNFCKPGRQARHNLAYWTGESYLGLGPSAHSFDRTSATRWKNVSSLHRYSEILSRGEKPVEWSETLSSEQLDLERWMLALRLSDGFPRQWLDTEARRARAERFSKDGLLEPHPNHPGRLRLTARGFALSDQVIQALS